jgi:transposase
MQAYTNYNTNSHLDYSVEQLRLPLDLSIEIDKNDPMWTFLEVIEEVNLNKYLKKRKGNQGHNNRMMLKTVLFAYMNRVFSLRHMEEKCRTDIRFMYLSEEEKPSFMAFQRFINNQLKASVSKIFTDITEIVCRKSGADTRILFLDGTMIEANANKFTFVWKKTAEKTLKKSLARVQEVIRSIEKETELKYKYKELTPDHLKGFAVKVLQYCLEKEISFVYGRGKRKTAIQI